MPNGQEVFAIHHDEDDEEHEQRPPFENEQIPEAESDLEYSQNISPVKSPQKTAKPVQDTLPELTEAAGQLGNLRQRRPRPKKKKDSDDDE